MSSIVPAMLRGSPRRTAALRSLRAPGRPSPPARCSWTSAPSPTAATRAAIPGALVIERNVLEWRLDPEGDHRVAELADRWQRVILVCDEGYASSLAAATLQSIGLAAATDLVGRLPGVGGGRAPGRRASSAVVG